MPLVKPTTLAAVLLLLVLPSCFTMSLWGFDVEEVENPDTGREETVMEYDPETEWSWGLFGLRVLATPFSLVLDCVTAPVQAILYWNDDEDDDC